MAHGDSPPGDVFLNYSQISAFNRCEYMWRLIHIENIVPRISRPAPALGSAVHKGIEGALLNPDKKVKDAQAVGFAIDGWLDSESKESDWDDSEIALHGAMGELAKSVARRTMVKLRDEFTVVKLDGVPIVEMTLRAELKENGMPIQGWHYFRGTIDIVLEEKATKHIWLTDFKNRETLQADAAEEYNLQSGCYQKLLMDKGIPITGSMTWQNKAAEPRPPKQNKDGSASRALILTTWEVYKAALEEFGEDPEMYLDMKDKLEQVEWTRLSRSYRSKKEVDAMWNEVVLLAAKLIPEARTRQHHLRNLSFMSCNGCSYKDLCLERLRGGDTEFLLQNAYKHKDDVSEEAPIPQLEE